MKSRLTDLAIRKLPLPPKGQRTHWDEVMPGFGVRCSTRSKSFVVMYGAKRRLKTLGRYPDQSLADARKRARLFLATQEQLENAFQEYNYEDVVEAYLRDCQLRLRDSTLNGYLLYLTKIRFTGEISKVERGQVLRAIERYTHSPSSQNYAFTTFKVFFNWAVRRQYLDVNPLGTIQRPNKLTPRERVLSDAEVRTLLAYSLAERGRFCDILSLLLLTGQRRGEIAGLEWTEVGANQLNFPANRTKNRREHTVPLGPKAVEILSSTEGGPKFVFGTADADKPFNGWARAQRRCIRNTALEHFTLHDLRRTFSTIHAKIGTPIHVTERLLNHVSGTISGVAAVYNRHSYAEEMRVAVDQYDEYLANLLRE